MNIADMSNSMSAHNATCWHNWLIHVGGFTIAFYDVTVDLIALPTGPAIGQLLVWYARPDPRHWRRLTLWGGGKINYLKVGEPRGSNVALNILMNATIITKYVERFEHDLPLLLMRRAEPYSVCTWTVCTPFRKVGSVIADGPSKWHLYQHQSSSY